MQCPKCGAPECSGGLDYIMCLKCGLVPLGQAIGAAAAAVLDGDGYSPGDLDTVLADPAACRALEGPAPAQAKPAAVLKLRGPGDLAVVLAFPDAAAAALTGQPPPPPFAAGFRVAEAKGEPDTGEGVIEKEWLAMWDYRTRADADWQQWDTTRKAELAAATGCSHGAPVYKMCLSVETTTTIWCKRCGALGTMGTDDKGYGSCDPGHQTELPNDWRDGRGFGYTWALPAPTMLDRGPTHRAMVADAAAARPCPICGDVDPEVPCDHPS